MDNGAYQCSDTSTMSLTPQRREKGNTRELEPLKGPAKPRFEEGSDHYAKQDTRSQVVVVVTRSSTSTWNEFLFPSDRPRQVQILRWENIAIPFCYLVVGTMQGLVRPLLNVYPIELGATEAQQTTLSAVVTLPATLKIVFGFISDNSCIYGYRRKPYMLFGWLLVSSLMAILCLSYDLTMTYDEYDRPLPPVNAPSLQFLSVTFFLFGIGMWMADVMADSLVAQKVCLEPDATRGSLQSTCYALRFFGLMVAAPLSTYLYSEHAATSVIYLMLGVPLTMPVLIHVLQEERTTIPPVVEQLKEIWKTASSRCVWQPMAFIYVFNLLQLPNAAWKQFLQTVLHFTAEELNALLVASYILLYVGTMVYKYCFLNTSWRHIYQFCILTNAFLSGLQLLLIRGNTFDLSPFLFALGDDAFAEFLAGIQFLPITIMMVSLVPAGSEGASYAMFTTYWNSAMLLSPAVATSLLRIWDVSKETLEADELDGLFKLSLLTTFIQTLPVLLIFWLPRDRDELYALGQKPYSGSAVGGGLFLGVLFSSMAYAFIVSGLNIFDPGWDAESR